MRRNSVEADPELLSKWARPMFKVKDRDFSDAPLWRYQDEFPMPSYRDIRQGQVGDCWFLAALAALVARSPLEVAERITKKADGRMHVTLDHRIDVGPQLPTVRKTWLGRLLLDMKHMAYADRHAGAWVAFFEKAAAKTVSAGRSSYTSLTGGSGAEGMALLGYPALEFLLKSEDGENYTTSALSFSAYLGDRETGERPTPGDTRFEQRMTKSHLFKIIGEKAREGHLIVLGTRRKENRLAVQYGQIYNVNRRRGYAANHAHAVVGVTSGNALKVYDPHGREKLVTKEDMWEFDTMSMSKKPVPRPTRPVGGGVPK